MALIIETGAQVANSDSYVTRAAYIAHALTKGITIADAEAADVQLRSAAEFIDSHEANLKGDKVSRDQSMAFPRVGVVIDDWSWTSTEIPRQVLLCQMALALDINASVDLYNKPVNPNIITKREKVEGAVEIEYAVSEATGQKLSRSSRADALLNSLLENSGLTSIRMIRA